MDRQTKALAFQAIDENVQDSTARQICRYVMECELNGFDTIRPTNSHIAKKYGWTLETTKVAIAKAKRSQFITTTGRDKSRTFELNVQFLKGKMGEIAAKKPLKSKSNLLAELAEVVVEPNHLPNHLPNLEPNLEPNLQQGANNNRNNNNNYTENQSEQAPPSFPFDEREGGPARAGGTVGSIKKEKEQELENFIAEVLERAGFSKCRTNINEAKASAKKALKDGKTKEEILKAADGVRTKPEGLSPSVRSPFQSTTFWMGKAPEAKNNFVETGSWADLAKEENEDA